MSCREGSRTALRSLLRSTDNSKWIMSRKEESGRDETRALDICNWIASGMMHSAGRRSLKLVTEVLLTHVVIILSLCLPGSGANLNVTWCLDSNDEQLLNLSCGSDSLIRISSVMHGWRNAGQEANPGVCLAPMQDNCAEKYPNSRLLLDTCSGLSSCVISSLEMPAPLSSCSGRRSDYVYITYECIIVGNESTIVNICDNSQNERGPLRTGYITSPNYPHNYDSNTKCSCVLSTSVAGDQQRSTEVNTGEHRSTEVVLLLLDFELSSVPNERSPFDWLQYGREGRNWGDGRQMGAGVTARPSPMATVDPIFTDSDRVDVDFNADGQREGRGFWVKVIGLNITSKEEIPVEIKCDSYTPPDSRQALSCFYPPRSGELYLSCTAYGVINILSVRAGYRPSAVGQTTDDPRLQGKACTINDVVAEATCNIEVDIPAIESECMKRRTCNPPAPSSVNLTSACADQPNDFVLVDYQCIPDSGQSGNMVNICGDDMTPGTTIVREYGSGFISSPLYPSNYPPDCNCFCRLEVTTSASQEAQIVFYVLDLKVSGTSKEYELGNSVCSSLPSGCSSNDSLQYGSVGQIPGVGRNLSTEEKGKPVYTGSSVVLISFQSDSSVENRGFWIKYVGRSVDGSNAPVVVQCGRFQPYSDPGSTRDRSNGTEPTSDTSQSANHDGVNRNPDETVDNKTGLIVGLTFALIVFVVLIVALIAVFHRRRQSRMQSAKLLNESKTNSWNSRIQGQAGISPYDRGGGGWGGGEEEGGGGGGGGGGGSSRRLFAPWKRGSEKTRSIDKQQHSPPPFAIFYNDAYKMQDPTIYRNQHTTSVRRKRLSPTPTEDETIHF